MGFPGGTGGKESTCNAEDLRDLGSIPGLKRSPGGGHGNPLQYSCLENPIDRGAWWATAHGVAQSWTWLKWLSMHARSYSVVHIQYPVITTMEKIRQCVYMYVCVYIYVYIKLNHLIVHLKLTQHCKSTVPWLRKKQTQLSQTEVNAFKENRRFWSSMISKRVMRCPWNSNGSEKCWILRKVQADE